MGSLEVELSNKSTQLHNIMVTSYPSGNGLRSALNHNFERSSFDLERSLSLDDDSDTYYTANSDENDSDFLDSGCFPLNEDLNNCTAGIKSTHFSDNVNISFHISSSNISIPKGTPCHRNSSYCLCQQYSICSYKRSCQMCSSSVYMTRWVI